MALIICPECGKEFSDRAKKCPQCACPIEYVLSVINGQQNQRAKRVVRKPAPIRVKPYQERKYQRDEEDFSSAPKSSDTTDKRTGLLGKFDKVVDYVKTEGVDNILDNALRVLDDSGKRLKDMSDEGREKLFDKCECSHQLLVDMRHAGWSKEITVYNREWAVLYKGSTYFRDRINDGFLKDSFGKNVFSVSQCNPNEYKWEIFPSDRYKTMMEKAEIYFDKSIKTVLSYVPSIKKEIYKLSKSDWNVEINHLNTIINVYDANNRHIATIFKKISSKTDIYVIDYWDEALREMFIALSMAIDVCKSSYEPKTIREKLDW